MNRIIADFMGQPYKMSDSGICLLIFEKDSEVHFEVAKYDIDWEALMPVIEKISRIVIPETKDTFYPRTFGMIDEDGKFMFRFNCCSLFAHKKLIKAAYAAVVDFLKNYKK